MSDSPENEAGPESQIRALLGAWSQRIERNPVPDFARRISIVSIRDWTVHAGFLRCLFDVRTGPVAKMLAYRESSPPKIGDKNDPWSVPVELSRQFLEQEGVAVAAEPGEPQDCNRCAGEDQVGACETCRGAKTAPCGACSGRGRKSCPACKGLGKIACGLCAGSGKVLLSLAADGTRSEDVCPECTGSKELPCRDCADATAPDCAQCANKRVVPCPTCGGRGAPLCPQCGGARKVVQGFSYQVAYKLAYYRSLVRDASIPEAVFPSDPPMGKLGETVLEWEGEGGPAFDGKKPEGAAGEAFARVLSQVPPAGPGPNSRLILQALSIERIPIYEVAYGFEGKEYHAWVGRYENRVVALDDPFGDLAARWAADAEALLQKGEFGPFEDLAAKAEILAPRNPAVAALRGKAGAVQRRAVLGRGAKIAAAAAASIPLVLSFLFSSPNRYAPLAALGLIALGLSLGAVLGLGAWLKTRPLLPAPRRNAWAAGAASAGALLAAVLFLLLSPIRRVDVREFSTKLSRYEALPFENWGPDDAASLELLIKEYSSRGVDASAGQNRLDEHASFLAAARAQALAREAAAARLKDEQARREAARREAARRAKESAAKKLAEKKRAAKKAKSKKSRQ